MAQHGKLTSLLVGGVDLSRYFNDIAVNNSTDMVDSTMFQPPGGAKEYTPGMSDGTLSAKGKYVSDVTIIKAIFEDVMENDTGDQLLLTTFGGVVLGNRGRMGQGLVSALDVTGGTGSIVGTSTNMQSDKGFRACTIVGDITPFSATQSGAALDNGASTANGLEVHLHAVADSWSAGWTPVLQHSADNTTWVDLYSFGLQAAGTTPALVGVVAAGTTVNRYLRMRTTLATGTGSLSYAAAVARN